MLQYLFERHCKGRRAHLAAVSTHPSAPITVQVSIATDLCCTLTFCLELSCLAKAEWFLDLRQGFSAGRSGMSLACMGI